jgi:integrase
VQLDEPRPADVALDTPADGIEAPQNPVASLGGPDGLPQTPASSSKKMPVAARDPLAAILPLEARARMALILTEDDFATLRHLAEKGTGPNTLRAIASDLNYLETWAHAALGHALPWPATEALALKFIAHHLYDEDEHERDASHGMPKDVRALLLQDGCLKTDGPHAPATVRRRLALWSTMHRWKGFATPFGLPSVRHALRLAVRANPRPRARKSAKAVTKDVLEKLIATCNTGSIVDLRDRAILLIAFASGGRRRSEIAQLRIADLVDRDPVWDAGGTSLPAMEIRLGRTKTASADSDERVYVVGRPVVFLKQWLALTGIRTGPVFRAIDRFGRLAPGPLGGQSINAILKKRCALAGLPPAAFSAHGLRSGYLTEAARQGVPLQEAMAQSRHRSVQQAADYYNGAEIERGLAARLG